MGLSQQRQRENDCGKYAEQHAPESGTLASEMGLKSSDIPHVPDLNIQETLGLPKNPTLMDKIIQGFGQYAGDWTQGGTWAP